MHAAALFNSASMVQESTPPTFFAQFFAHTKRVRVGIGLDIEQYHCKQWHSQGMAEYGSRHTNLNNNFS